MVTACAAHAWLKAPKQTHGGGLPTTWGREGSHRNLCQPGDREAPGPRETLSPRRPRTKPGQGTHRKGTTATPATEPGQEEPANDGQAGGLGQVPFLP